MNEEKTIAIHPNTIGFGYVVLNEKGELLDYGMVSIRPVDNKKCLKSISEIMLYYQPQNLILEDLKDTNKSDRIKKLLKGIYEYEKHNIKVFKFSRAQVKSVFEIFKARNKFEISRKICEVYPQLKSKLPEKRKAWEPENYYQGIFDSISLVLTHHYFIDKY